MVLTEEPVALIEVLKALIEVPVARTEVPIALPYAQFYQQVADSSGTLALVSSIHLEVQA